MPFFQVDYLIRSTAFSRVSILYQADSFGQAGYDALCRALAAVGLTLVSSGSYLKTAPDVGPGLASIVGGAGRFPPQAVVVQATTGPAAAFVMLAKGVLPAQTVYLLTSPAGTDDLLPALAGIDLDNIFASQVSTVPSVVGGRGQVGGEGDRDIG